MVTPEQRAAADLHRERFGKETADEVLARHAPETKRALITGDRGFLGRHFKAELVRRGYEVTGLDVKATSSQDCRAYFRSALLSRPAAGPRYDLVVHCAAVVGGREMIENSPLETAASLSIDAEMFRWAAVAKPGRVIYFSSSAAYPAMYQDGVMEYPLQEDMVDVPRVVWQPDEIYGWSKVTGEVLAGRLREAGVPVTVVRPFSGYGADQDDTYPFRAILERARALEDGKPLEVWCGECVRDWVHVDDVVGATLAIAEDGTTEPVNICTGRPTSFYDLARLMLVAAGKEDHGILANPDAPQGVRYRVGDPARMIRYYVPQIMLETGITRALRT